MNLVKLHLSIIWDVSGSMQRSKNGFVQPAGHLVVGKGERQHINDIVFLMWNISASHFGVTAQSM